VVAVCEVESVWQIHTIIVGAKLKNGEELATIEPKLEIYLICDKLTTNLISFDILLTSIAGKQVCKTIF
jgi:hypothetical protein